MGRDEIPSIPSQFCHSKTNATGMKPRSTMAFSTVQGADSRGTLPLEQSPRWEVTAKRHPGSSPLLKQTRVPWRNQFPEAGAVSDSSFTHSQHRIPDPDGSFGMLLQHTPCIAIAPMNPVPNCPTPGGDGSSLSQPCSGEGRGVAVEMP